MNQDPLRVIYELDGATHTENTLSSDEKLKNQPEHILKSEVGKMSDNWTIYSQGPQDASIFIIPLDGVPSPPSNEVESILRQFPASPIKLSNSCQCNLHPCDCSPDRVKLQECTRSGYTTISSKSASHKPLPTEDLPIYSKDLCICNVHPCECFPLEVISVSGILSGPREKKTSDQPAEGELKQDNESFKIVCLILILCAFIAIFLAVMFSYDFSEEENIIVE